MTQMPKNLYIVLYVVLMIVVIVGVDALFFRNQFWPRLMVNVGIVLVFGAFYFVFLRGR
jgi:type IV secretory pathway VirB2 component (pilin)